MFALSFLHEYEHSEDGADHPDRSQHAVTHSCLEEPFDHFGIVAADEEVHEVTTDLQDQIVSLLCQRAHDLDDLDWLQVVHTRVLQVRLLPVTVDQVCYAVHVRYYQSCYPKRKPEELQLLAHIWEHLHDV